jgi:hypothetical protein
VTTVDIHDIARSARTYDLGGFYVITPLKSQRQLVQRLVRHWVEGKGAAYNPHRKAALSLVRVEESMEGTVEDISRQWRGYIEAMGTRGEGYRHGGSFPTGSHRLPAA